MEEFVAAMFVSKQETGNATGCLSENLCPKVGENPEMLCRSCRSCRCCGGVGRSIICRPVWRKTPQHRPLNCWGLEDGFQSAHLGVYHALQYVNYFGGC
jgi:hypothetical protein